MKKKILFINGHLNTGGVEKSLADILRKIDLNKFDVKLLLLEDYGDYINQIPKNVKIELFDLHNTYGSLLKSLTNCLKQRDKKCFWTRIVFFLTRWFGRDKLRWLGKTIFKNEEYDCVIGFRPGIQLNCGICSNSKAKDYMVASWRNEFEYSTKKRL